MNLRNFWYIAATSKELKKDKPLGATILGESVVLFRDKDGKPVALRDRCLHRNARLSKGFIRNCQLVCPYHGWHYSETGKVTLIPSEGVNAPSGSRPQNPPYPCREQEGYIYVQLEGDSEIAPFGIPQFGERGFHHIRLINDFKNTVTNCAENFVDIPHTVFVHPSIFRKSENRKIGATVRRAPTSVHVDYHNEESNLGWFSFFLNPKKKEIIHKDNFYMPNITSVEYYIDRHRHFYITSQSIPISEFETRVYTDLTYDYGIWNRLSGPIVRWQAQKIIDQDIEILNNQGSVLQTEGAKFTNSPADIIHVYIESIRNALEKGEDPRALPAKQKTIEFWV